MGVDIQTYRAKIGTYRHSYGLNVVTQVIVINFSNGLKSVGCVLFIGILLIMAGVEQNPGPSNYDNANVNEPLETTKIKVTEVSQNITKEVIELFFQEQGWGEIKEVTEDTIDKSVIIEFVDAKGASEGSTFSRMYTLKKAVDAVLQQLPICILGTTVTVERFDDSCDPDECKFDPDALQSDEAGVENIPSTKIRVTGLPKGATNEVLIMFFENEKRQGGGRVRDITFVDDGNSAIVDFEDASAVDKVMQNKPIDILGQKVNVEVFVADDSTSNARPTKMEVIGLPKGITDEILTMFFENEHRQGGGPVKRVTIDDDKHVGVVEFEEPGAVETVMQKQPIVICDTLVKIQIIRQQQLETEEVIKTIKVSGLPKTITDEILLMFFENEKRQGGGKVTEIRLNKKEDSALVEFEEEKAVRIVLEKQPIRILGHQVRVEKYMPISKPVRMENTKICVTGLPDTITDEVLIMFFENEKRQGGGKVVEVVIDKVKRCAIIEFETPTAVIKVLQNRPISIFGTEVNVDTYDPAKNDRKLLVSGLPGNISTEFLTMFFEHENGYGGGPVKHVKITEDKQKAIIEFEEKKLDDVDIDNPKPKFRSTANFSLQKAGAGQDGSTDNTCLVVQDECTTILDLQEHLNRDIAEETSIKLNMSKSDLLHDRRQSQTSPVPDCHLLERANKKMNQPTTVLPEHRSANETLLSGDKTSDNQVDTNDTADTGHLRTKESYTRTPQQQLIANDETAEALPCTEKTSHGQMGAVLKDDTERVRTQATTARMSQQQENANNEAVNKHSMSPIAIVETLGLSSYIHGRITIKDMIMIDPYKKSAVANVKQLPWILLKRILSVNNEAMDLRFQQEQEHSNAKRTRTKRSVHALFDSLNEREDISPLDVFLLAFQCCDPMLKQLLYKKLFLCKMAVPFIYREPFTLKSMLSLWPLRFLLIENKNKKGENEEAEILDIPTKIVTFARFGRPKFSKSKLLNRILSETVADVFFNKDCPFGTTKRIVTNGFVEMFWLPLIGNTRCRFNDTVTFLNMRGDIGNSFEENECAFTAALTDIVVMVCDLSSVVNECKDMQKSLVRFSSVILIIASPINKNDYSIQKQLVEFERQFTRENMTEMQIMCTHEGLHEKSATEILTDILEVISDYLIATPNESRALTERLQSNIKLLPNLDENKAYIHAKETALSVVQMIENEASQDQWFFYITPTQSSSSCQLSDLLKQQQTERDFSKHDLIKQKIKDLRLNQTEKTSSSMEKLMEHIMKSTDSPFSLQYFLNWLRYYLEYKKRRILPGLINKNQSAWEFYWKMKKGCNSSPRELQEQEKTIKRLEKQIDEASFGIENLLREIYHICDAVLFLKMDRVITLDSVNSLADAVACMVCNGHTLELLDGNSFYMPTEWIKLVLNKIQGIIGPKKVLTLSVLGLQSSGKSTMLNTMFGIQFSASPGRCTRGIHMQMIPLKQPENMQQRPFDYVIVIDTEGLRAPELSNKSYKRDNELATIITGLGDITILNVMGENMSELRDILQILIHAFLRLKLANERLDVQNSCYFVHQNVTDITASEKMKTGLQISIKHLDSVTEESALSEGISHITTFNQVIEFDTEKHVWHLPNLWQDNPPIARVNRKYSEAVVDICQKLILKALDKATKSYKSLHDIYVHTEDLWKGVLAEDFVFSFRNSLEKKAYVDLETKLKNEIWCSEKNIDNLFHKSSQKMFSECDDKNSLTKASSLVLEQVKDKVAIEEAAVTEKMKVYFSNNDYKDTTIKWKQHTMNQIRIFCKEMINKKAHELDIIFNKRAVDILTNSMHTVHEEQLRKETIQLANELKGKSMTQTEINNRFEEIWDTFVSESLKSDNLKESESTLEHEFIAVLNDKYTNRQILVDILQKQPLRDRNPDIRKLEGTFRYTNISEKDVSAKKYLKRLTDKVAMVIPLNIRRSFTTANQRLNITFKDIDLKINQLCIENKEITSRDVRLFLENVFETVENISEPKDHFTLKVTFKIKTVVFVSRFALSCFDRHNEEFNKVHGSKARLAKYKQQVKERFDAHLVGCKTEDTAARLFRLTLEDFLYETVKEKLPMMAKHCLKGQFPTLKYHLIIDILDDLTNNNRFEDWIHYIKKPKDFADSWIISKSESILFDRSLGKYYELATDEINSHLREVTLSITRCGQHLNHPPITIHAWIENFLSNLSTYTFPREYFREVVRELEPVGDIHIDHFTSVLLQNVQNSGESIASKFRMVDKETIKWTTFNPYTELLTDIWGCPEHCIICGEPCMKCSIHTDTHRCIQHRPTGCRGTYKTDTRKISLTSCNFKVASDKVGACSMFKFRCNQPKREACPIEKHPYKQYRQFLPEWDIEPTPDMEYGSKFWMWFMATYKQELSKYYDIDVSDIPKSWGDIKKEDACESLRNIYK